jgi:hypothetical protein
MWVLVDNPEFFPVKRPLLAQLPGTRPTPVRQDDQQFQAGFTCNGMHATPTVPLPSPCLASRFGSTLISVPAPGTENDDHNPQRIKSRSLFDIAVGADNIFKGDRYQWSAQVNLINLTNNYVLYNFLSTFSGTHCVTPRIVTAQLAFHF